MKILKGTKEPYAQCYFLNEKAYPFDGQRYENEVALVNVEENHQTLCSFWHKLSKMILFHLLQLLNHFLYLCFGFCPLVYAH